MPVFLVNQAFSLRGPFKCVSFLKYALKGTGNLFLMRFYFFLLSMCSEDSVWSGWGSIYFPSLLSRSLVPSVPIKGFIRNKKRVLQTVAQMWDLLFKQLLPVWPTMVLGRELSQPPAASTRVGGLRLCPRPPWRKKEQAWKKSHFLGGMPLTFIIYLIYNI